MDKFYCKCCGTSRSSVFQLTNSSCNNNPDGKHHVLYEGSEKSEYTCKYCGTKRSTLFQLTSATCRQNPDSKSHSPAI